MRRLPLFVLVPLFFAACGESSQSLPDATSVDGSADAGAGPTDANGFELGFNPDMAVVDTGTDDAGADAGTPADTGSADSGPGGDAGLPAFVEIGGARPAPLIIPQDYDGTSRPLVIVLHGYTVDGATQDLYFGFGRRVNDRGYFMVLPDGTQENSPQAYRFWNATQACCNFYGSTVDDVGYILGLIDEASALYNIDQSRVHLVGHSNGGFMAHRMACEHPDRIASIASLAGVNHFDDALCNSASVMSVLQIHGDSDDTIMYQGGFNGPLQYPSAMETVTRWATRAGCDVNAPDMLPNIDLDTGLAGDDTEVTNFNTGCAPGRSVDLWHILNGEHIPSLQPNFADLVLDWLYAHPRP